MQPGYFPVLLWSLVILLSFWGYGEALRRWINRKEFENLGWGLTTAWGMALLIMIGGFLMAFHLAKAPVLTAVVLFGAAVAAFYLIGKIPTEETKSTKGNRGNPKSKIQNPKSASSFGFQLSCFSFSALLLYSLAALAFASSIAWPFHVDPNDDLVCYLMLPEKILATGTLIEPFSFQRAGTFGGQSLLQALVMIVGDETNGHVPDRGLAMVVLFGILSSLSRNFRGQHAIAAFFLLVAYWFVPVPRISTPGAMTGGCLLIAFLETFRRVNFCREPSRSFQTIVPLAFLMAGACSIRPTVTIVLGAIFLGYAAKAFIDWKDLKKRAELITVVKIGVGGFILLIPFMTVLYASNGTPIIPPFSGYVSKAYQGMYGFPSPLQNIETLINFLRAPEIIGLIVMLAIAAIVPGPADRRWILGCVSLASLLLLYRFGALAFLDLYRFVYPIIMPVAFYYLILALQADSVIPIPKSKKGTARATPLAVSFSVLFLVFFNAKQGYAELVAQGLSTVQQIQKKASFFDPRLKDCYAEIQNTVPAGQSIMTMVDASYWLDYTRNPMASINIVGGSSPPPGLPIGKGANALRDYLKGQGYRYFIAVDFNNAALLYTRRLWTVATRPEWFYSEIWRPHFLDVMNSVDQWDQEGLVIKRSGNLRLFDLGQD